MRRSFARHIPKPDSITRAEAKAQLACLIAGCTDERLRGFTASGLAGMFKVAQPEIAAMLERERVRRA